MTTLSNTSLSQPQQSERANLRRRLRVARRSLSPSQHLNHAFLAFLRLSKHPWLKRAEHIGIYLAADGELQTTPWLLWAHEHRKRLHLPVICGNQMHYKEYRRATPLARNRYDILEPQGREITKPEMLDVLLMPLVGFDEKGGRLGMGGGFYDRFLANWGNTPTRKPICIGLAHELQKLKRVPTASWDQPVTAVATEKALHIHQLKRSSYFSVSTKCLF